MSPTPLPHNGTIPAVVTFTPPPENLTPTEYLAGLMLLTGTPTVIPHNLQALTPTPIFVTVDFVTSPTAIAVPPDTSPPIPTELLGKVVFLSEKKGITEVERIRADKQLATPKIMPHP